MTSYEPSRARPPDRRPTVAVVVGVGLAVLVLVAAVTSLRRGDGGDGQATPTTVATSTNPEGGSTSSPSPGSAPTPSKALSDKDREEAGQLLVEATPLPGPVPEGDYEPVCTELQTELKGVVTPTDVVSFIALLEKLDLPKLTLLAPAKIRPSFIQLLDLIPAARDAVGRSGGVPAPADLPPGFLASTGVVLNSFAVECFGLG